jgi:hypothetical protein
MHITTDTRFATGIRVAGGVVGWKLGFFHTASLDAYCSDHHLKLGTVVTCCDWTGNIRWRDVKRQRV